MDMTAKQPGKTWERLLAAASEVFVEKGYRDTTVSEICARAEANISAVNYYFGSKESIYREAWRHSFDKAMKAHPPDGGVNETAPPEERLRGHLKALMARIADENNKDFMICQMELTNPTGLLKEIMRSELTPLREKTQALVRELLGPGVSENQVQFSEIAIVSMCINPMLMRRIKHATDEDEKGPFSIEDLEAYADHVTQFSLAGIAAIRDQQ